MQMKQLTENPLHEEILALADRYKQYEGGNGDELPLLGMVT